jgi:hypothetical protein
MKTRHEKLHGVDTHYWESNGTIYIHNVDGPAVIYDDGRVAYTLNGFEISKDDFDSMDIEDRKTCNVDDRGLFVINGLIDESTNLDILFQTWEENEKILPLTIIHQLEKLLSIMADTRSILEDYLYNDITLEEIEPL